MAGVTSLDGKVVVVTGASRGIGLAVADRLESAGSWVARLSRTTEFAVGKKGGGFPCDVTDEHQVRAMLGEVEKRAGLPDILVSNAGAFLLKGLEDTTADEFREQILANLLGPFVFMHELLSGLVQRDGHVVTIGSIVDYQVFPGNAAYASSKHGLRALHEVLAVEYRGKLRTTLISPGPTDTSLWDAVDPDSRSDLPDRQSMLHPADVADAVVFALTRPRHANIDVMRLSHSGLA